MKRTLSVLFVAAVALLSLLGTATAEPGASAGPAAPANSAVATPVPVRHDVSPLAPVVPFRQHVCVAGQRRQQQPLRLDERRPRLADRIGRLFVVIVQGSDGRLQQRDQHVL
jgi:hypothetical protein